MFAYGDLDEDDANNDESQGGSRSNIGPEFELVVLAASVEVRSTPSKSGELLGKLLLGDVVSGQCKASDWGSILDALEIPQGQWIREHKEPHGWTRLDADSGWTQGRWKVEKEGKWVLHASSEDACPLLCTYTPSTTQRMRVATTHVTSRQCPDLRPDNTVWTHLRGERLTVVEELAGGWSRHWCDRGVASEARFQSQYVLTDALEVDGSASSSSQSTPRVPFCDRVIGKEVDAVHETVQEVAHASSQSPKHGWRWLDEFDMLDDAGGCDTGEDIKQGDDFDSFLFSFPDAQGGALEVDATDIFNRSSQPSSPETDVFDPIELQDFPSPSRGLPIGLLEAFPSFYTDVQSAAREVKSTDDNTDTIAQPPLPDTDVSDSGQLQDSSTEPTDVETEDGFLGAAGSGSVQARSITSSSSQPSEDDKFSSDVFVFDENSMANRIESEDVKTEPTDVATGTSFWGELLNAFPSWSFTNTKPSLPETDVADSVEFQDSSTEPTDVETEKSAGDVLGSGSEQDQSSASSLLQPSETVNCASDTSEASVPSVANVASPVRRRRRKAADADISQVAEVPAAPAPWLKTVEGVSCFLGNGHSSAVVVEKRPDDCAGEVKAERSTEVESIACEKSCFVAESATNADTQAMEAAEAQMLDGRITPDLAGGNAHEVMKASLTETRNDSSDETLKPQPQNEIMTSRVHEVGDDFGHDGEPQNWKRGESSDEIADASTLELVEKRIDEQDGNAYSYHEFIEFYEGLEGFHRWKRSQPQKAFKIGARVSVEGRKGIITYASDRIDYYKVTYDDDSVSSMLQGASLKYAIDAPASLARVRESPDATPLPGLFTGNTTPLPEVEPPQPLLSSASAQAMPAPSVDKSRRRPAAYYGIVDLKYNNQEKHGQRVKVLELGNSRSSRFSGHGEVVPRTYQELFRPAKAMDRSALVDNKKMTHDVFVECGYECLRPKQVCYPRSYTPSLASQIAMELGLLERPAATVVLKLLNRCRGAGVVVARVGRELDELLRKLLVPPADFLSGEAVGGGGQALHGGPLKAALSSDPSSLNEQCLHWWSNECPVFVAEVMETSSPIREADGQEYDATMRVGFVVLRDQNPEENSQLSVEFLGGYWKLPQCPINSTDMRAKCVSKAKSGTAAVRSEEPQRQKIECDAPGPQQGTENAWVAARNSPQLILTHGRRSAFASALQRRGGGRLSVWIPLFFFGFAVAAIQTHRADRPFVIVAVVAVLVLGCTHRWLYR